MSVTIDPDLCESSGVCAMVCPEDVFEHEGTKPRIVRPAACTFCWICVENCASGAISLD